MLLRKHSLESIDWSLLFNLNKCIVQDVIWHIFHIFVCNRKKFKCETFFLRSLHANVSQDLTFPLLLIIYLYIFITMATLHHNSWILIIERKQQQQIIKEFITHQQNRLWVSNSYISKWSRNKDMKLQRSDTFAE